MSDDQRQPHDEKADELERELDHMGERQERLGGDIESADSDWESRKRDESVPGATGELDEDGDEPGDGEGIDGDELDFGRDADTAAVAEAAPSEEDSSDEEDSDEDE